LDDNEIVVSTTANRLSNLWPEVGGILSGCDEIRVDGFFFIPEDVLSKGVECPIKRITDVTIFIYPRGVSISQLDGTGFDPLWKFSHRIPPISGSPIIAKTMLRIRVTTTV
jgi:hypothetical protein